MSLDDDISLLASVELFDSLSSEQLRLLAFGAEKLSYGTGRVLYREGQHADCGFAVIEGVINLVRNIKGHDVVLRQATESMCLGEMAMITQTSRLTTAIAAEDSKVLRINRTLFRRMLEEYPETAADMHAKLTRRLTEFLDDIGSLDQRFEDTPDL